MCDTRGKKRAFILISSDEDDDDCYEDINGSTSCDNDDDAESGSDFDEDVSHSSAASFDSNYCNGDDQVDKEEGICKKVTRLLEEGSQLEELNLVECKTYLRKLKLRLSGTKVECINRIKEYWRIKDGNGEALYPRSSFNINCTGDVCKGDIVLFTRKVYQFDKMKQSGNILGKRTIAGRITKGSYGAAKQQHTFTVEVFWSKGIKKLALFPLLVKG